MTPIKTGILFFADQRCFRYRRPFSPEQSLGACGTPLEILARRLLPMPGVFVRLVGALHGSIAPEALEALRALKIEAEPYSAEEFREKPYSHSEERWQIFSDRGSDSWLGSFFSRVAEKHGLDHLILVPLANVLVDRQGVMESLELHLREGFDITWSEDRIPGANWVIFSGDLLRGLQKSHADVMAVRGGLAWMVRKPIYPFRIGEHHSPRTPVPMKVDVSLYARAGIFERLVDETFARPEFSYHQWLGDRRWLTEFTNIAPQRIVLEPTNKCSGACFGCPQPSQTRPRGDFAAESAGPLNDEFAGCDDCRWVFSGMGEPFRHPQIEQLVAAVSHRHVTLISGLESPPPESMPWKMVDLVRISVDACERKGFEAVRPGCSWETVEHFVRAAGARKAADPEHEPEIGISFLRHEKNAEWAPDFLRYWKQICHPAFRTDFFVWPQETPPEKIQWFQILGVSDFLQQLPRRFPVSYVPMKRRLCHHALTGLHILWDGRVTICPFDYDGRHILGDLKQAGAAEIWNGPKAVAFRAAHIAGEWPEGYPCRTCQDWYHPE